MRGEGKTNNNKHKQIKTVIGQQRRCLLEGIVVIVEGKEEQRDT